MYAYNIAPVENIYVGNDIFLKWSQCHFQFLSLNRTNSKALKYWLPFHII